jgi:hypothetical protein
MSVPRRGGRGLVGGAVAAAVALTLAVAPSALAVHHEEVMEGPGGPGQATCVDQQGRVYSPPGGMIDPWADPGSLECPDLIPPR